MSGRDKRVQKPGVRPSEEQAEAEVGEVEQVWTNAGVDGIATCVVSPVKAHERVHEEQLLYGQVGTQSQDSMVQGMLHRSSWIGKYHGHRCSVME